MLSLAELEERQNAIAAAADLRALQDRLMERAAPVLARMPPVPRFKSRLTADGGVCPQDGTRLVFDPWNPTRHRCGRCGRELSGERHDWAWAHYQHLWLAERSGLVQDARAIADACVPVAFTEAKGAVSWSERGSDWDAQRLRLAEQIERATAKHP